MLFRKMIRHLLSLLPSHVGSLHWLAGFFWTCLLVRDTLCEIAYHLKGHQVNGPEQGSVLLDTEVHWLRHSIVRGQEIFLYKVLGIMSSALQEPSIGSHCQEFKNISTVFFSQWRQWNSYRNIFVKIDDESLSDAAGLSWILLQKFQSPSLSPGRSDVIIIHS